MKTAVVTIVHGRAAHLRRQLEGLAAGSVHPDTHIVVALGDNTIADAVADAAAPVEVLEYPAAHPLPLAAGRNAGALAALRNGADLLVFLDVDCIPGSDLIERYRSAADDHGEALLCGPVTYLPPAGPMGYIVKDLQHQRDPHPARPAPAPGTVVATTDYALFWSLSFAVRAQTWRRIGGFYERYRGYGGEDTDFAQCAAAQGVPMCWVGGADAFHQYHPVTDPPVDHLDDIVRNAAIFHRRWGWWPMGGWLSAFESEGLISRDADGSPRRVEVT